MKFRIICFYYSQYDHCKLPNRGTFGAEFTDADYALLCDRLRNQHQQFRSHKMRDIERKVQRFKGTFGHLTIEEIFVAFREADWQEEEVALRLTRRDYISQLRQLIAVANKSEGSKARKKAPSKTGNVDPKKPVVYMEQQIKRVISDEGSSEADGRPKTRRRRSKNQHRSTEADEPAESGISSMKRMRLDEALANESMEGWSEARIRAFKIRDQNPNAYYYRFNAPGEQQRNGGWSEEEHQMFMARLKECGADGQWGIFSMAIPGRVGYQCSNYYRKLIDSGQLHDQNYTTDGTGKTHFKRKDKESKVDGDTENSPTLGLNADSKTSASVRANTRASAKATARADAKADIKAEINDDRDADTKADAKADIKADANPTTPKSISAYHNLPVVSSPMRYKATNTNTATPKKVTSEAPSSPHYENPLPEFIDAITCAPVVRPAISPYGHVLSYATWLRCLLQGDRRNTCPLTNQPLHKRQLIFVTPENIEMYRDRIIGLNCDNK